MEASDRPLPPMPLVNSQDFRDEIALPGFQLTPDDVRGGYAQVCAGCGQERGFVTYEWIRSEEAKLPEPRGMRFEMMTWEEPSHRECPRAVEMEGDDDEDC